MPVLHRAHARRLEVTFIQQSYSGRLVNSVGNISIAMAEVVVRGRVRRRGAGNVCQETCSSSEGGMATHGYGGSTSSYRLSSSGFSQVET